MTRLTPFTRTFAALLPFTYRQPAHDTAQDVEIERLLEQAAEPGLSGDLAYAAPSQVGELSEKQRELLDKMQRNP